MRLPQRVGDEGHEGALRADHRRDRVEDGAEAVAEAGARLPGAGSGGVIRVVGQDVPWPEGWGPDVEKPAAG